MSPECSVFWVQASDATSFDKSYREIAQKLGIPGFEDDKTEVKQSVFTALTGLISPWLLIVDNADDYKVLEKASEGNSSHALIEYLPNRGNGAVLFTTRDNKTATKFAEANVITIREMNRQESIALLKTSMHVQKHNLIDDEASLKMLLALLLDLPLAIKQAAAYMNENSTPIAEYLSFYNNSEQEIIEILSEGFEDRGRYRGQKNPVATTWFISFEQIQRDNSLAAEYLSFIGVIARDNIPRSLLLPGKTPNQQTKAIGTLTAYSFVTQRLIDNAFDVHQLVHLATRNWLAEKNEQSIWADRALNRLVEVIPDGGYTHREVWTRYLSHGIYLVDTIEVRSDNEMIVMELRDRIGGCQYDIGQYIGAEKMYRATLALKEQVLGKEHPWTLVGANNLAVSLNRQDKYAEAEAIHRATLALREEVLGKEHPSTLTSINNLAESLSHQGKYAEAEAMHRATLELQEEVLGKEQPSTLTSMNNLAQAVSSQGKSTEAEAMHRATLELKEKVLGKEHSSTLTSMNNLALALRNQGKYAEADTMLREELLLSQKVSGKEHPSTLTSMNNLAAVLSDQGKYAEAETMHRATLALREEVLGKKHLETLTSMNNLAYVLSYQGKYTEAEAIYRVKLALMEEVLGKEHLETQTSMNELAQALSDQGKYAEAETMHRATLALREEVLGKKHPSTLTSMNNLAGALSDQGKYAEAEKMHRATLALREEVLGKEHPATLGALFNLANVLQQQENIIEATKFFQEELSRCEALYGPNHAETIASSRNLANILEDYEELDTVVGGDR